MRKYFLLILTPLAMLLGIAACTSTSIEELREEANPTDTTATDTIVDPCDTLTATWDGPVSEIITRNCAGNYNQDQSVGCHQSGAPRINFTSYANVRTVVDDGKLEARIFTFESMPPSFSDDPNNPGNPITLSACDRTILRNWLDNGAPEN